MDGNAFGRRLKELRETKAKKLGRRKIPQREVAAQLNISPGAYGSWESGRTMPGITLLPKVADYFQVSIDYLLSHIASVPASLDLLAAKTDLVWSLRRPAQTEGERKGVEAWARLVGGESLEKTMRALQARLSEEVDRVVNDVVYADMISIDHLPQDNELADQVRRSFGLREVVVVPTPIQETEFGFRTILLGEAARTYFKSRVYAGMKMGIAGGYSVSRMVYALRRGECQSIEVYPLAISPVTESIALDANSLVGAFAYWHHGYNVRGYTLQYASPRDRKKATNVRSVAPTLRILAKAKSVDIAFIGLGMVGRQRAPINWLEELLETGSLDLETLRARGAVGDILHHLVDQEGRLVAPEISNLVCSIDLQDLQQMVHLGVPVVAIASGQRKAEIARTAAKAGYANVFIIDDELARALLESEKQPT